MSATYHRNIIQGTEEWLKLRCGVITASEIKTILTPSGKPASNDKARAYIWQKASERVTGFLEPVFETRDMLRGHDDEGFAKHEYSRHFEPVSDCGFVTAEYGSEDERFIIGYSPDGLVGNTGLIECKSRKPKFQIQTLLNYQLSKEIPSEYMAQIQTGLLVTGREWCDFISYCGGLPMITIRVFPDRVYQARILDAVYEAEQQIKDIVTRYQSALESGMKLIPTERRNLDEIY
jgi:hypothetical protein